MLGAGALLASLLLAPSPVSADPASPGSVPHTPSQAAPTIAQVQRRLASLDRRAEIASEAVNTVKVREGRALATMTGLKADLARQRSRVATLRTDIVQAALSDYESTGGLSSSASFLVSKTPGQFLNSLATSAIVEHQQASLLVQLRQQQNQLGVQNQQAQREVAAITASQHKLALHKAVLDKLVKAARGLLGRLKEKERLRVLALARHQTSDPSNYNPPSRGNDRTPTIPKSPPASGRAAVAVSTALAQLGKPYVYGAAGPNSFDCSGLTMYSWAAAGVYLSHSASVQSQQGVPVSLSALQPGDLVFYYSPISHVAMYIGNGMVVHAPHPGSVVQIVPLYSMPVSWARRVG